MDEFDKRNHCTGKKGDSRNRAMISRESRALEDQNATPISALHPRRDLVGGALREKGSSVGRRANMRISVFARPDAMATYES